MTTRERKEFERVVSAGGVMTKETQGVIEVALIFTGRVCGLPKGLVEQGETLEEAAVREVEEETGLKGEIVGKIGEINYTFSREKEFSKTVHFFLLRFLGGSIDAHDHEVDEVRIVPASEALRLLTHLNERRMVAKAVEMLKDWPAPSV